MKINFLIFFFYVLCFNGNSVSYSQSTGNKSLSDKPTQLRQYAVDETGTLTSTQLSALNSKLRNEDISTTNQILVYMIPDLGDESLEDISIRLAEKNKIGKKDRNNGVLILIVKNDRKLRIEVGYGLEGVLTDALCSKIIRNDITPGFKSGDYNAGINKGVDAVISAIKGEYTADNKSGKDNSMCFGIPIFILIIFIFIFGSIFVSILKSKLGIGNNIYANKRGWDNGGWGGGGGFGSGGSSSGGGGGFSGGGGSFGGGGSSGSW